MRAETQTSFSPGVSAISGFVRAGVSWQRVNTHTPVPSTCVHPAVQASRPSGRSLPLPRLSPLASRLSHSYALPPTERMVVLSSAYTAKPNNFSITNLLGDVNGQAVTYSANLPRTSRVRAAQQRIKANARERGRVHTIGAAFEALRRSVPVSGECKLTKLSVLRIAAAYIETLVACLEANRIKEWEDNGEEEVVEKPEDLSCTAKAFSTHPPSGATGVGVSETVCPFVSGRVARDDI
eukprot:TsM_000549600 transcript=TsM_000549600 gene=TsM_000549600